MAKDITVAIAARLMDRRALQIQMCISRSREMEGVAGAWAQAITEAYNQAHVAVLTDGELGSVVSGGVGVGIC